MSKSIRSYPKAQQIRVIERRLKQGQDKSKRGNGYWAAVDALRHVSATKLSHEIKTTVISDPTVREAL